MLGFWRKRKTFAVHLVFWPIIAVFIIWGFERYGNPIGGAAAVVNDHSITVNEFRNAVQRQIDFYNQIFQGNFDEKSQEQYHIQERALSQLVDTELLSEQAESMGLVPTDAEVRDTIVGDPYLQNNGKFSREYYDRVLQSQHMTAGQFENEERRRLTVNHVVTLFETHLQPSQGEIEKQKILKSQKKNVEFLKIDKERLESEMTIPTKEVESFLADEKHMKEVKDYYDLHQSEFSKPEEVHASHILVDTKEKADQVKKEVTVNNFKELAKKYSSDPGSKTKGGDLGWFSHGRMVPDFEKVAFTLDVGKISDPVKSRFGYHIIMVEGKHPLKRSELDEVKKTIAQKFLSKEKLDKALDSAEKEMASSPEKATHSLMEAAGPKLKWEETGFFTLADENIPKIGESSDVAAAALAVTEEHPIFPKLIRDGSEAYVVRFKKAEKLPALDDKKIAGEMQDSESKNILTAWSASLREKAKIKVNPQLKDVTGSTEGDDY